MANVQYYDVILKPVVTEKSMNAMAEKKYIIIRFSALKHNRSAAVFFGLVNSGL